MKEKLKKFILTMLAVLISFNGIIAFNKNDYVYCATSELDSMSNAESESGFGDFADVLLGIVLYIPKAGAFAVLYLVEVVTAGITAIDGADESVNSIEDIIFNNNEIKLISINFFDLDLSDDSTMGTIRNSVCLWYYSLRNLSIVVLLFVLIYVGIRMVISTVAEEEAKYKKMLKDWIVSLLLVFVLHYFMILVININNTLVSIIGSPGSGNSIESAMDTLKGKVWDVSFTVGVGSLCVYGVLVGITIIYLFMYIKRMLTVGFLIIIAPLITITYSIDKMGDGKSQALNTWLKEFIFNVLIQPFHCIIFVVFVNAAVDLLNNTDHMFSAPVIAVLMLTFTFQAESIVKDIFNIKANSLGAAIGSAAAIGAGISMLNKQANKTGKNSPNVNKMPNMQGQTKFPGSASGIGSGATGGVGSSGATGGSGATFAGMGGTTGGSGSGSSAGGMGALPTGSGSTSTGSGSTSSGSSGTQTGAATMGTGQTAAAAIGATQAAATAVESNTGKRKSNFLNKEANKKAALKLGRGALNTGKKYLKSTPKLALMMALGILGASTGKFSGVSAGIYAGSSLGNGITSKINKKTANNRVKQNESTFAGAYKNFQAQTGKTDEEMRAFTQGLMDGTIDKDNLTEEEALYNSYVNKMAKTYSLTGEDNIENRMQDTLQRIALPDGDPDKIYPTYADGQWQPPEQLLNQQGEENAGQNEQPQEPEVPNAERLGEIETEYDNYRQDYMDYNTFNESGKSVWQEKQERLGNTDAEPPSAEKLGELETKYNNYQQDYIDYNSVNPETGRNVWEEKQEQRRNQQNNSQGNQPGNSQGN